MRPGCSGYGWMRTCVCTFGGVFTLEYDTEGGDFQRRYESSVWAESRNFSKPGGRMRGSDPRVSRKLLAGRVGPTDG